ncbi:DUF1275 family protein, partial [Streptomyces sp. NPDC058953]|uniref:DUF1275 family protein n=1 Tax=Streptomyces sp. NPDC058953 TaxID=3346676 RepID=UPI0036A9A153
LGVGGGGGGGGRPGGATPATRGGYPGGAARGARLESAVERRGRPWFAPALLTEAALLAAAGAAAWGTVRTGPGLTEPHPGVAALVAVAMGLRNVTTLRAPVPDLPTSVATRSLTALLAPLGADNRIAAGAARQGRRLAAVTAMFAGGLLGALLLRAGAPPAVLLLAVAGTVLATAAGYAAVHRPARG